MWRLYLPFVPVKYAVIDENGISPHWPVTVTTSVTIGAVRLVAARVRIVQDELCVSRVFCLFLYDFKIIIVKRIFFPVNNISFLFFRPF